MNKIDTTKIYPSAKPDRNRIRGTVYTMNSARLFAACVAALSLINLVPALYLDGTYTNRTDIVGGSILFIGVFIITVVLVVQLIIAIRSEYDRGAVFGPLHLAVFLLIVIPASLAANIVTSERGIMLSADAMGHALTVFMVIVVLAGIQTIGGRLLESWRGAARRTRKH